VLHDGEEQCLLQEQLTTASPGNNQQDQGAHRPGGGNPVEIQLETQKSGQDYRTAPRNNGGNMEAALQWGCSRIWGNHP
jgi:hypothetical protein